MKINTNISALTATGNLHRTEDKITTSLTILSSGTASTRRLTMLQEWRFPRKCMRRSADFSARPVMDLMEFHLFRRQREH